MATIRLRGNCYMLQWTEGAGDSKRRERISLGALTLEQAERARKIKELELATGVRMTPVGARIALAKDNTRTLEDFFEHDYQPWHRSQYPSSSEKLVTCMKTLGRVFGSLPMTEITTARVESWKSKRMADFVPHSPSRRPLSPETVRKELNQLRAILRRAVMWGAITADPCPNVERISRTIDQAPRMLTQDELNAIYAADPKRAHWWRFIVNTGLRRAEACKARRADVHAGENGAQTLRVESTAKGRTKSGRARFIQLNSSARDALALLGEDRLFPPIIPRVFARYFTRAATRAGVAASLHCLRHTFCSHMAAHGVPATVIQKLAGHSTLAVTQKYLWMLPGAGLDAVEAISL